MNQRYTQTKKLTLQLKTGNWDMINVGIIQSKSRKILLRLMKRLLNPFLIFVLGLTENSTACCQAGLFIGRMGFRICFWGEGAIVTFKLILVHP